jgi:hypothetical protein
LVEDRNLLPAVQGHEPRSADFNDARRVTRGHRLVRVPPWIAERAHPVDLEVGRSMRVAVDPWRHALAVISTRRSEANAPNSARSNGVVGRTATNGAWWVMTTVGPPCGVARRSVS